MTQLAFDIEAPEATRCGYCDRPLQPAPRYGPGCFACPTCSPKLDAVASMADWTSFLRNVRRVPT